MKRTLITLLIMMLTRIICFSSTTSIPIETDSIILVTASDLKYTNLIFIEHNKLQEENTLLYEQLDNYKLMNQQFEQVDSLRVQQIKEYYNLNQSYITQIENLNQKIKENNRVIRGWQIGGITISVGFILFLLLK